MIIGLQLKSSVSNASSAESLDTIKTNAPRNYVTQDRMITADDYNNYLLNQSENILKIKMIDFFSETTFNLQNPEKVASWISAIISNENHEEGELSYIFCDDEYLHKLNVEFLKHDTLTDIISFDNSLGNQINGDIFISVERVKENASKFNTTFENELHRVIIHGVLHYCGYKDKTKKDADIMRVKENKALSLRDFL